MPSGSYSVAIGEGLLQRLDEHVPESLHGRAMAVISNPVVMRHYGKVVATALRRISPVHVLTVPDGERYKALATAGRLHGELARLGLDRSAVVVALGGGVIGDLAGFVAATFLRGVKLLHVPTTLLAQVDSSVGGKVAVNLREGKNLVGTFHQPAAVVADTETLATLPGREITAGLMEVIKYALLGDLHLWRYLVSHVDAPSDMEWGLIVEASVKDKARVVAADERESGHRRVLNLGHTLAHALESVTRYRTYLHGEAVGIGIAFAELLSQRLRRQAVEHVDEVLELTRRAGLVIRLPRARFARIHDYFASDKKVKDGVLHFVLPVGLGRVQIVTGIPERAFREAYAALRRYAAPGRGGARARSAAGPEESREMT
jgi:3-dehydroquinate synthase